MVRLILTEEQQELLELAQGQVEIVDRSGHILSRVGHNLSPAELDSIEKEAVEFRTVGTLQELLKKLQSQSSGPQMQ